MALGDSLAKGVVKLWARETEILNDRLRKTCYIPGTTKPGRYIREVRSLLSKVKSPWVIGTPGIVGKKQHTRLLISTLFYDRDQNLFIVMVAFMSSSQSECIELMRVTPHGMQRLAQLIGEPDRNGVAQHLRDAATSSIAYIEEENNPDVRFLTITSEDCVYHLDRDNKDEPFTLKTAISDLAMTGTGRMGHVVRDVRREEIRTCVVDGRGVINPMVPKSGNACII